MPVALAFCVFCVCFFGGLSLEKYSENQVKIAEIHTRCPK